MCALSLSLTIPHFAVFKMMRLKPRVIRLFFWLQARNRRVWAGLGGEHASLGDTWVDFRGLNCPSEWQAVSLADPKRKHFVGENGHFLSVNGPSKLWQSAPWIIHPSLRPHNVFCRVFLWRSSPLPFFFSDWIINRLPSSLAEAKAVSKLAFCKRAAQAWAPNRLSRFCLPSSSLSIPLCAQGVSLWGDGNRWTNVWSAHLGDIFPYRTGEVTLSSPI